MTDGPTASEASDEPDDDLLALTNQPDTGYAAALDRLVALLLDGERLEDILRGVAEGVRLAVPGLAAVSVTTVDEAGGYATAAATDPRAIEVDELEYELQLGPCVAALETGEDQFVDDVRNDDRWAPFNEKALEHGFLSAAGIALKANGTTYGALNLFADTADGIDRGTRDLCRRLAPSLAATLANARAYTAADRLSDQLQQRLEDLAVLHQAVGVLMVDRGCDAATAAGLLKKTAEATDRSVRDVATQIVDSIAD